MKQKPNRRRPARPPLTTELLVMPDGQILVHNLTQPFAELLMALNPDAEQIRPRAPRPVSRIRHHVSRIPAQ